MLLYAPSYLTNRSVRSLRASSLWRSGGCSAEVKPLIPSPSLARFWSIPDKRDNAIIPGFFDASLNFYFSLFTLSVRLQIGHETLPMMRFGPSRKSLCRSSTFEFCSILSMQRLLNPIFNVVNYRLWVILKSDIAFCSGFGTYHIQSSSR